MIEIGWGRMAESVRSAGNVRYSRTVNVIAYDPFALFIRNEAAAGLRLNRYGPTGRNVIALIHAEHVVVLEDGNGGDLPGIPVLLFEQLPEHYEAALLALSHAAACSLGLIEGDVLSGLSAEQKLVEQAVGPAGGI